MTQTKQNLILIVDDAPANLKVLFEILQQSGFKVSIAKNGESALAKVEESLPDLILLDVMMPNLDGFETCRRLKANPQTQEIPVMFISALEETINKVQGFKVGGVDYITKPFQTEEVLARVKTQLALGTAKAELRQLNLGLEQRVQQRTAQLATINQKLSQEIAARVSTQEALLKSEEQFRLSFDLAPIGMAIATLEGKFVQVNQVLSKVLGYTSQELRDRTWADVTHPDDLPACVFLNHQLHQGEMTNFQIENRYLAKDGSIVYALLNIVLVRDSKGQPLHFLSQFVDISDRKQAEEQLVYNTLHDPLTRLPNRNFLLECLNLALERAKQDADYLFAVLCIDLDRFKVINESLGHHVGDEFLVAVADKLKTVVRPTDMVARLDGDEFVILLDPIKDLKDAIHLAEQLCKRLSASIHLAGQEVFASASIGIVLGTVDYDQGAALLRDADIAMYRAKAKSKGCYEVFAQGMYSQVLKRLQLENDLRLALERQEFQVYYQPIVSLHTGYLTGFEALVRWQHRIRGSISPTEFIPIAEESGLIVPLGELVLRTACQQLSVWQQQYPTAASLKIHVNLSVEQLREPDFLAKIDRIISKIGIKGHNLTLELTESMLMDGVEQLLNLLSELKARGIQLSIDDFGTGYSSLSYLHRFPVNHLKIDRSFICYLPEKSEYRAIVETIIALAHQLGISAIAEGLETLSQFRLLQAMGCEEAQGYLFAKPLDRNSAEELLKKSSSYLQMRQECPHYTASLLNQRATAHLNSINSG
jgi:diguanylate cyclase (GGDEF)-like protein/PAS domain S-box-containing protein